MDSNGILYENTLNKNDQRKKIHIPFCDVDDLAFKNRHDPNFIASITNLMQVPATITLSNGNLAANSNRQISSNFIENASFPMDMPDKLTVYGGGADGILKNRNDYNMPYSPTDSSNLERYKENDSNLNLNDTNNATATPPSTPTKMSFSENAMDDEKFSKTPQIAADLFNRMRPRRSSIEADLHSEIRILRDKINVLEHECQINSRSCKVFYAIICGYILLKTFSWLVNSK